MAELHGQAEEHDGALRDAALGVAAFAGRAAADVASAAGGAVRRVTGSPLGELVGAVSRPVVEPLAEAGQELREDAPVQLMAREIVELVAASLDLDELLARVDLNALLATIDLDALLASIDLNSSIASLDLDAIVGRIDLDAALAEVDVDTLAARVDVDALLDRVDPDRLLDRVDPNRLLDRVDADRLLARVDANALIDRVDVNQLVTRVDVDALIAQTELGAIVAKSTSGVLTEALDVVRSQGVGLDALTIRWVNRALRRQPSGIPPGPPRLVPEGTAAAVESSDVAAPDRDVGLQGHYAGGITRFAAAAIDASTSTAIFGAAVAIFGYAVGMVTGHDVQLSNYPLFGASLAALWYFLWFWYPWSLSGRTLGMAVVGLRIVQSDGANLRSSRAFIRTVTFPLSFLAFGLGFLGIITDRRHRAWHDRFADTAVVYAWDARVARLRFLAKQGVG